MKLLRAFSFANSAFLLLLFALLLASCSENDKGPVDPAEEPAVLLGRVTDAGNASQELGGLTVRIEGTDWTTVTEADGSFQFEGLQEGDFTVVVEGSDEGPYRGNRIGVHVRGGDTLRVDVTVLPRDAEVGDFLIYPPEARVGILESVHFWAGGVHVLEDGTYPEIAYRPTWTILSEAPIGVISREGIFIGTAAGKGVVVASFGESLYATAPIEVVADGDVARILLYPPHPFRITAGESRYLAAWAVSGAGDFDPDADLLWEVSPELLGTIEPVDDLSEEEKAEVVARLLDEAYLDYGHPGDVWPGGGGGDEDSVIGGQTEPGDRGPIPWVDPDAAHLVRFFSAVPDTESVGTITVRAGGADWGESVRFFIFLRGELQEVSVYPSEINVLPGGVAYFHALGRNEWGYPVPGLEYEWSVSPAGLGTVEEVETPWVDPAWPGYRGGATGADTIWPDGDEGNGPLPPWGGDARFDAGDVGDGRVIVLVTDLVAGVTVEGSAVVRVVPPPVLERVEIRPNPIEAPLADSVMIHAVPFNDHGDIAWGAVLEWELIGEIGVLTPLNGPYLPDPDDTSYTEPGGPWGGGDPGPGGDWIGWRAFFLGTVPGGEGVVRVTAISPEGVEVTGEAPVRVVDERR